MASPAVAEQAAPMVQHKPKTADDRKAQLRAEIRELIEQRKAIEVEIATAERVRELQADVLRLEGELSAERSLRSAMEIRAQSLEAELSARWNLFKRECAAERSKNPERWDAAMRACGELPTAWIKAISELPNGALFLLFLGSSPELLNHLRELKDEAAITRIRRAAFDFEQMSTKDGLGA